MAIDPAPFAPVLRGLLRTERDTRWLQRDLGSEPSAEGEAREPASPRTKFVGRELSRLLDDGLGTCAMTRSETPSGSLDTATRRFRPPMRWPQERGRAARPHVGTDGRRVLGELADLSPR